MSIKRRQFLQFAGSSLFTLGLSQLSQQAESYGKVLALSTPRKLALIVGINDYPSPYSLQGCGSDMMLQHHLLKYRFGFKDSDILTLENKDATRQGILSAFEEHLIKQAQPGDVVVFHYSGHGSRIVDPDPAFVSSSQDKTGLEGTIVPVDAINQGQGGVIKDIMGHTLFLLVSALKTENVTVVLDSCFSGAATRNDFKPRSRAGGTSFFISPEEKIYQDQLLSRLNLSRSEFIQRYRQGIAKGVVLAATSSEQTVADARLDGFYAGAFTYNLTQYLWQQTSSAKSAIAGIEPRITQKYSQTPLYEAKVGSRYEQQPIYFTNTSTSTADGVVTAVQGNQATLWLGGVNLETVDDSGTVFNAIDAKGRSSGKVILLKRTGLEGTARVSGVVKEGTLLHKVR